MLFMGTFGTLYPKQQLGHFVRGTLYRKRTLCPFPRAQCFSNTASDDINHELGKFLACTRFWVIIQNFTSSDFRYILYKCEGKMYSCTYLALDCASATIFEHRQSRRTPKIPNKYCKFSICCKRLIENYSTALPTTMRLRILENLKRYFPVFFRSKLNIYPY